MKAEPLTGVPVPHDVEAVLGKMLLHMIEASEGSIELFTEIVRETGTVAGDEAVLAASPFAENIDWMS